MSLDDPDISAWCGYPINDNPVAPNDTLYYSFNCDCNATIVADADIAGPGVWGASLNFRVDY